MKKALVFLLVIAGFVVFLSTSRAAFWRDFSGDRRDVAQGDVDKKREELKDKIKERRDTLKSKLSAPLKKNKNATSSPHAVMRMKMQEHRAGIEKMLDEKRADFEAKASARKNALQKKIGIEKGERVEDHFAKILGKFSAAIGRLRSAVDKVEARFSEAEQRGKSIGMLAERLADADAKIGEVEQFLEDLKARYGAMTAANDMKTAFRGVADETHALRERLKSAHAALVAVVRDINGLSGATAQ